jgi:hypothetical protein
MLLYTTTMAVDERERKREREREKRAGSFGSKKGANRFQFRPLEESKNRWEKEKERERERERERVRERERERKIGSRQQAKFGEQIRVVVSDGPFIPVVVGKQETKEHRK